MNSKSNILTDSFKRKHTYLRISLTDKCNLRCDYCMPEEGIELAPRASLMTANEIYEIAKLFVENGVTKIRLTGGEPLVRKDFKEIIMQLAKLPAEIAITTNGILLDRYLPLFTELNILNITVSIDSLHAKKFNFITKRNYFDKVWENIQLLKKEVDTLKLNVVLMKGINDNEITDFIELSKKEAFKIRFIEFMPFDGNKWNTEKLVSEDEILNIVGSRFKESLERIKDQPNDTSKNYKLNGFKGSFAIISSVTNPFCDTCNRIRLTADGKLKNCLFSNNETNLLTAFRNNKPLEDIIYLAIHKKKRMRGGMDTLEKLENPNLHSNNRSMIAIGG